MRSAYSSFGLKKTNGLWEKPKLENLLKKLNPSPIINYNKKESMNCDPVQVCDANLIFVIITCVLFF